MAAPVLQAQGAIAAVTTGSLVITLPSYEADDIVVLTQVLWVPNTTSTTATPIPGSATWIKYSPDIQTITGSTLDAEYAFHWARATSSTSLNTTVGFTRSGNWDNGTDTCWAGRAYVIRGCATTGDPFDQLTATAVSTAANPAFPAVTVNAAERLVAVFMAKADNTTLPTAASGYTANTVATTSQGTDAGFQSYTQTANTSVSAVTPSGGTAPGQGGSVYFGVSFKKPLVTISRTGSDTGTGTESATGARVAPIVQRTASDTGTGTEDATGIKFRIYQRTATSSGTGTEEATGRHSHPRTASSVGTGTESATGVVIPGTILHQRTASASGAGTETAVGLHIAPRTASDTGTGTESATGARAVFRTASNTGTGSESATGLHTAPRTGSATGTGTETSTQLRTALRTATATGSGTESATGVRIVSRTATGTGTGTQAGGGAQKTQRSASNTGTGTESATGAYKRIRTAAATGTGTQSVVSLLTALRTASNAAGGTQTAIGQVTRLRTASASGTGAGTVIGARVVRVTGSTTGTGTQTDGGWTKSFIFRPPTDTEFRWASYYDESPEGFLGSKLKAGGRASNVFRLTDGTYTTIDPMDPSRVVYLYLGGHNNFVSAQEKADLIAAGYTVT